MDAERAYRSAWTRQLVSPTTRNQEKSIETIFMKIILCTYTETPYSILYSPVERTRL